MKSHNYSANRVKPKTCKGQYKDRPKKPFHERLRQLISRGGGKTFHVDHYQYEWDKKSNPKVIPHFYSSDHKKDLE